MIRHIAITAFVILGLMACKGKHQSEELNDYLKEFDTLSLPAAKARLTEESEQLETYLNFFKKGIGNSEEKGRSYKPEEESYEEAFTIPKPEDMLPQFDDLLPHLELIQDITYPSSQVSVSPPHGYQTKLVNDDKTNILTYEALATYYHNGTVDKTAREVTQETSWNTTQVIDSVLLKATYSYVTKMSTHQLDKGNTSIKVNGGEITLKNINKNTIQLVISREANKKFLVVQALNKEGKVLDEKGYRSGNMPPGEMEREVQKFNDKLKTIVKNLQKDKYKTTAELTADMRNQLSGLLYFEESEFRYLEHYYAGNVATVVIYTADERQEKHTEIMVKNESPNLARLVFAKDSKTNKYGFLDSTGNFASAPIYDDLNQINAYYFEGVNDKEETQYLKLNEATATLEPFNGYTHISTLNKDLVIVENEEVLKGVLDRNGKIVVPVIYEDITFDPAAQCLVVKNTNNLMGILNLEGKEILPVKYIHIEAYKNGRALVTANREAYYGFIDTRGKLVIDLRGYNRVQSFTEGLAEVEKSGLHGFMDVNGKMVIPLQYQTAYPFEEGITAVQNEAGEYALINTKNEVIMPFKAISSVSIGTGEGNRSYTFDGQEYNAKGQPVKKKD